MYDYLVVGGGVIGMLTARLLAAEGAQVALVERGRCGQEASWAGGGIVSPLYPWQYTEPVTALSRWAQTAYPELSAALAGETGIDLELDRTGLLMLDPAEPERALRWAQARGAAMEPLEAEAIYQAEPALAAGYRTGLWVADTACLRPPRLGAALRAGLAADARVRLLEHTEVTGFQRRARTVTGVDTDAGPLASGATLVCAGAWSARLLAELGVSLSVAPVRGQMLMYQGEPGWLRRIVLAGGRYLIPRRDGRILAGSTLEDVGFDRRVTREAGEQLHSAAQRLLPSLREAHLVAQWSGLRPGSPDGVPFIGALGGYCGLYVNAGHHRNGLVLAPAAARVLVDELLGRSPLLDPAPYRPSV